MTVDLLLESVNLIATLTLDVMNGKKVMLDCAANFVRIDLYQMNALVAEIISPAVAGSLGKSASLPVYA